MSRTSRLRQKDRPRRAVQPEGRQIYSQSGNAYEQTYEFSGFDYEDYGALKNRVANLEEKQKRLEDAVSKLERLKFWISGVVAAVAIIGGVIIGFAGWAIATFKDVLAGLIH